MKMSKVLGKRVYNIINISVILLAVFLFARDYGTTAKTFSGEGRCVLLILIPTTLMVHAVKAGRLYLALYGADISFFEHIKLYCKVIPVSVLFPFKLGEFFRIYCYGRQIGSGLKGIVLVLLDRVMDTLALVTMMLLVRLFYGGQMTLFVYLLIIFLVVMIFIYYVFPSVYVFWKGYLLRASATEKRLAILKMLEVLNVVYREVENVIRGRGTLLYFMSLAAWGVEIGSVIAMNELSGRSGLDGMITRYFLSAMGVSQSDELRQFVFVSVVLLMAVYVIIKFVERYRKGWCLG